MNRKTTFLIPAGLLLALAGCKAVGPDYQAPDAVDLLVASAQTNRVDAASIQVQNIAPHQVDRWWEQFGDPTLIDLLKSAYSANRSLVSARERVREARARLNYAEGALYPMTDLQGGYQRTRTSENGMSMLRRYNSYTAGFDASWELDIFGGLRREIELSEASLQAEEASLEQVWVTLAAEVAQAYVELRTLQQRLQVAEDNLALQTSTFDLLKSRFDSGLGDALAMSQSAYNMENTRAAIPQIKAGIESALNALAVLVGATPGTLHDTILVKTPIPLAEAVEMNGIPAEYLRRRPDVRVAERGLAVATAAIGVAESDLYPRFFLSGSLGLDSLHSGTFLRGGSRSYSFGPAVSWPLLAKAARIRDNIEAATAQERQAYALYELTLLTAVQEVRTALSDYAGELERQQYLRSAVTAAKEAVEIAEDQYNNGLSNFNNVLDAQRSLFSFQEAQTISEGNISTALIRMYKSLSGGYQGGLTEDEAEASETEETPPETDSGQKGMDTLLGDLA